MLQELIVGDTLNFLTQVPDYPATAAWVLKFRLVPRTVGGTAIAITAIAEGEDFRVTVAAATTTAWGVDDYTWTSWVEKGAEVYSVDSGQIAIKTNPRTAAAGYDGRSVAAKALDQARAALAAWTPTTRRYRIGDRELEFSSKADIVGLISYWTTEVAREQRREALAKGMPDPSKAFVRVLRA